MNDLSKVSHETVSPALPARPQGRLARMLDSDLLYSFRRNKLVMLAAALGFFMVAAAVLAPVIAPHNPYDLKSLNLLDSDRPPAWDKEGDRRFLLGTDDQGRDVLARVIYGFRISVLFGLILTILSSVVGIAVGAAQGYYGGWLDLLMQRFLEIWGNIPELYVLIIIAAVLVPGFWTLLLVLLAFSWTTLVGLVRAEFLRARNFEYVRAAKALGLSDTTIMIKHVLPNATVATLTFLPFVLSGSITTLTSLDFLGLGLPPGSPSLGELLLQGKKYLEAPWLGITGFLSIAVTLSLLIFVFEGVRDALDPRKTFR